MGSWLWKLTVGFFVSVTLFSVWAAAQENQGVNTKVEEKHSGELPAGLLRLGDGVLFPPYALVVDKSKKLIHVVDNSSGSPSILETYESDLGKHSGRKTSTGDAKTPEGIYFLQRLMKGPGLDPHMYGVQAYATDYPNFFDLRDGRTGTGIWLHAIDDKVGLERGSKGCVVVRNDTIKKLGNIITLRETPLMIFDKVQWVPAEEAKKGADAILDIIAKWKASWENKDVDQYIGFYDQEFKSGKMTKDLWRRYKTDLASRYKDIKVSLSMPVIYEHNDTLVVRFYQDYNSSDHSDFGEKTLYFLKRPEGYRILGETWQETTNPKARSLLATNLCCQK